VIGPLLSDPPPQIIKTPRLALPTTVSSFDKRNIPYIDLG